MTSPKPSTPLSRRTKVITAASIGAVGLASLFAIGANLGILARADDSDVGAMSAAGDVPMPAAQVVGFGLGQQTDPLGATSAAVDGSQHFTVDTAGSVDVSVIDGRAHLDLASPSDGWTATPATGTGADVAVVFTDGTRTLEFTAVVGPHGTVTGDLTESTTEATTSADHHDDDHDDDHGDHDDHDSDHHDDHDHDGSDDDD